MVYILDRLLLFVVISIIFMLDINIVIRINILKFGNKGKRNISYNSYKSYIGCKFEEWL